jgi:thiosulfate dehydrogenase
LGEGLKRIGSLLLAFIALVVATAAGLGIGYLLWGEQPNWYAVDVNKLGSGPEAELIRYGRDLIINTPTHLGKSASNPAMRYAGNDLACQNCHLNAGFSLSRLRSSRLSRPSRCSSTTRC